MRPYLLKGHERPLTQVKYNREGDLLVTCAKNLQPCLWWSETGQRIGTYEGHNGAVWSCDVTVDSDRLITASADQTVRIWQLNTGKELFQFKQGEPCRSVKLSIGESLMAFTTDAFMGTPPMVHIVKLEEDVTQQSSKSILSFEAPKGRITRVFWSEMNRVLVTSHDGGFMRKWDSETGKMLHEVQVHEDAIQDLQLSADGSYGISASLDKTAKLVDIETFEVLKTYRTGRFVQSAAISPIMDHVVLGGGQDASQVTTTAAKAGGFEARFYHKIYAEEFGNVRGHFGPINTVAFHPDGRSFTTGGEDGYVRIHHFDMDYFTAKFF
mmetsp:Transcript_37121/g.82588  ORF Transcript_37121/g.82588 Transcript_37121/m.82588 type:complete len:325 (+) Transcript_37121:167-1141(+)|eukprot:CAMPEP_0202900454 /NCGR_PEP_ID=MMETSP1392-20130828/11750_1 /ASSEMBLY_ACC=CAM_ASM_000868 /TAXON_ID=225041 /ORGANISM="Chlamydomonas chlamydogama, Strain SAG 11-48b" /LENGTH=324 /DNA_ID=CAMNT_0049586845 /DNA_START=162 /DNA_END=1136 /DNA_ORIENTATION=-